MIEFNLRYFKLSKQLWEQATEPSAAGGGFSEAEEEKNKENREALQASEATMAFLGSPQVQGTVKLTIFIEA